VVSDHDEEKAPEAEAVLADSIADSCTEPAKANSAEIRVDAETGSEDPAAATDGKEFEEAALDGELQDDVEMGAGMGAQMRAAIHSAKSVSHIYDKSRKLKTPLRKAIAAAKSTSSVYTHTSVLPAALKSDILSAPSVSHVYEKKKKLQTPLRKVCSQSNRNEE
jgi:hypothetical protein